VPESSSRAWAACTCIGNGSGNVDGSGHRPVLRRTWHLAQARLAMARRSGWPIPAFVFLAPLGAALALLVREALPPFAYSLLALSVGAMLLAFPLLSDLGALLRHDEGGEWVGSLPALAAERALARTLHLLVLLGGLVLSW